VHPHVPGRDEEGQKLSDAAWIAFLHERLADGLLTESEAEAALNPPDYDPKNVPRLVKGVARFCRDVKSLASLFSLKAPPLVTQQAQIVCHILHGFRDASGKGFRSTMLSSKDTPFRIGAWDYDVEQVSSNFQENLGDALVCLFTDNSTVEAAVYKGNALSSKFFDLVLRLKKLEMKRGARFVIIHVSGKQMMAQGTNGVSKGQFKKRVTSGDAMLSFVPIAKSALDVYPPVKGWMSSWAGDSEMEFLKPKVGSRGVTIIWGDAGRHRIV
jgi:hypothetical protein